MPDTRPTGLITGASRGLGAAIARALAPTHDLLLGGRPSIELDTLATELDGASTWPVELTDLDEMAEATESIGRLDLLVHNAGVASIGTIEETPPEEWRRMLEVNLISVAELTRLTLPALRAARGHVVLINSGQGKRASPGWSAYAASKFGLTAFAEVLRAEEPTLRVTSIFPGRIDTDMQQDLTAMQGREYDASRNLSPEAVAAAVAHAVTAAPGTDIQDVVIRPRD